MNKTNRSQCETALATLRPASAESLEASILESLRLAELRAVRRKATNVGLLFGSLFGATTTAIILVLAFTCFRSKTNPAETPPLTIAAGCENGQFFDELDDVIRSRFRARTFEPDVPPNRDRSIVQQLFRELASGRPDVDI